MRGSAGRRRWSAAGLAIVLLIGGTTAHAATPDPGSPRGLAGAHSPAASTIIDTSDRAAVRAAYRDRYLATRDVRTGWTGSVGGCRKGTTSDRYRRAAETQIDYFRGLVGLEGIAFDAGLDAKAQAAALMMDAANALSHSPGPGWPCSTKAGREGAGSSNICLGCSTAEVAGYIADFGRGNEAVGHRRWLFYPPQTTMGIGATTSANAIYVLDTGTWTEPPAQAPWIAWPPAGFLPRQHIWSRFSLSRADADFSQATVKVTFDGTKVGARTIHRNGYYGDPAIVFTVSLDRFVAAKKAKDHVFRITVSGILVDGQPVERTWRTTVFDPR